MARKGIRRRSGYTHRGTQTDGRSNLRRRFWRFIGIALFILAALLVGNVAQAQMPTEPAPIRAGLVIQGQGGKVSTYCLSLPPDKANGLDALYASGIDVNAQAGPLGAAVCRLQEVGCTYPAQTCFCQCSGTPCSYWAYFNRQSDGSWRYSSIGAKNRTLKNGDVDGWLWSESTNQTPVGSLPAVTFDAICAAGETNHAAGTSATAPDAGTLIGAGVFLALALILGGVILWQRRRRSP